MVHLPSGADILDEELASVKIIMKARDKKSSQARTVLLAAFGALMEPFQAFVKSDLYHKKIDNGLEEAEQKLALVKYDLEEDLKPKVYRALVQFFSIISIAGERKHAKDYAESWIKKIGVVQVAAKFREKFNEEWLFIDLVKMKATYTTCVQKHKRIGVCDGRTRKIDYAVAILKSKLLEQAYPLD
jgi:hypothetical protein